MAETLLLADDSTTTQRVVELTFAGQGLEVVTVSDGHQALEYLSRQRPALALVSATLPEINGFEVVRAIRDRAELRSTPVLLLVGPFDNIEAADARHAGAADVLFKPLEPGFVIKRVKELLGMSSNDTEDTPAAGTLVSRADTPAPPASGQEAAGDPDDAAAPGDVTGALGPALSSTRAGGDGEGDDYLGKLDAAFASLDARLAGRPVPPGSGTDPSAAPSRPATDDPEAPAFRPSTIDAELAEKPVFEVDEQWFSGGPGAAADSDAPGGSAPAGNTASLGELAGEGCGWNPYAPPRNAESREYGYLDSQMAPTIEAAAPPTSRPETPESREAVAIPKVPEAASPAVRPAAARPLNPHPALSVAHETPSSPAALRAPESSAAPERPRDLWGDLTKAVSARESRPANASGVADAFAMLWAQEQGEPLPAPPPLELDERTIDAVAHRVTDAVASRVIDTVASRVNDEFGLMADGVVNRLSHELATAIPKVVAERLSTELTSQISGLAERVSSDISQRVAAMGDRISSDLAEQVASRVAERLLQSTFGDRLRQTVHEVSERLVREEIARIRNAVRDERP